MKKENYQLLISACLFGERVRYDAKLNKLEHTLLQQWINEDIVLPVCPEVIGGLPTPRAPAEIMTNGTIQTVQQEDVSEAFHRGAQKTLAIALKHGIKIAILTERSPSCGSSNIYNGEFSNTLIEGQGITTQLLRNNGILVFNQFQLEEVQKHLSFSQKLP
ncbi:DUF523 domain-containing protein [Psychromonas sp. psych-6C06]|uniref:DUF523 domain-containing protein n=1 Tax=Psychromonas sp. psych-6C06 TaxID=2058089 RepID=UPI000C345F01|nr:DUF523 domain-containing protein [Psychromonas sp. psych-6C06]PKF61402.1 DUF523 domain-containing protein [Psychromonas sp. psych-6C06]